MKLIVAQLLTSGVLLALYMRGDDPLNLWLSGTCFGVALVTTILQVETNGRK